MCTSASFLYTDASEVASRNDDYRYDGDVSITRNKAQCMRWDAAQRFSEHRNASLAEIRAAILQIDGNIQHNHCRAVRVVRKAPWAWCFIRRSTRGGGEFTLDYDLCDVPRVRCNESAKPEGSNGRLATDAFPFI